MRRWEKVRLVGQDPVYEPGEILAVCDPWVWVQWPDRQKPQTFLGTQLEPAEIEAVDL